MSIKLYMDVHVRRAVTVGLRLRGVGVVTAQEDNAERMLDDELLRRASELDRVLFSQDDDLLSVAASCQKSGERFAGVIYAHQLRISIGQCIEDLSLIAEIGEPEDMADRVEYLPL